MMYSTGMPAPQTSQPAFVTGSQGGQSATDPTAPAQRRKALVDAMMGGGQGGGNYGPVANPMQGVGNVAQQIMGGAEQNWMQQRHEAAMTPQVPGAAAQPALPSSPLAGLYGRLGGIFGTGGAR